MPSIKDFASVSGFFLRVLAALLVVNLGAASVLIYIAYTFSTDSLSSQIQETITQQVSVYGVSLMEDRIQGMQKTLKALEDSEDMRDFQYGSEAERLILARRIERRFIQEQKDNSDITGLYFYGDMGDIQIGVKDKRRLIMSADRLVEDERVLQTSAKQLFKRLQESLLLVSSGDMEWFIPPREVTVVGPFMRADGGYTLLVGLAMLDVNTGLFGGMLLLHFNLDNWLEDLSQIRVLDQSPVWVFGENGQSLLQPKVSSANSGLFNPASILSSERSWQTRLIETGDGLVAFRDIPLLEPRNSLRLVIAVPDELLLQNFDPAIEFFSWVMIVSVILLVGVSYFISNFLVRPFLDLAVARNKLITAQRIAKIGHWEWDRAGKYITLSENAIDIFGFKPHENKIDFAQFLSLVHIDDRESLNQLVDRAMQDGQSGSMEFRFVRTNGSDQYIHQAVDVIEEEQHRVVGTVQDISERRRAEVKIRELAYSDPVTGLANRRQLDKNAANALQTAKLHNKKLALIFLDLDQFKRINDTMGHDAGDVLLRQVAERLLEIVRPSDTVSVAPVMEGDEKSVARLGGDEFIIMLPDIEDQQDALNVAERIHVTLNEPFLIYGKEIHSSASLGISLYPEHGKNIGELLRRADAAMYHAKALGRNRVELFNVGIDLLHHNRLSIESALHNALVNEEFELFYQPRFSIDGDRIVSFEALIRWRDPEKGMVMPDEFIYIAEENGMIIPIGQWVMQEACSQLAVWQQTYGSELDMSVNLSPAQFLSRDLVSDMKEVIRNTSLSPGSIELELTETALFKDIETGVHIAHELKKLGLKLSIDDFGTGYSSLRLLRRLPVDTLKIDQSFVRDMLKDRDDAMIVQSFIMLGHNLGLKIVAEGVEEEGQWLALRELNCDELQGYFFGKPCCAEEATQLLAEGKELHSSLGSTGSR